ncbi:MAG: glycerophosphodiester phosphodiesterase family protein [Patescibacteria group bacterium]|nr:glycerophosphodiester phosphodiesterase family protein [Patescibacteria group bacterium]
MKEGKILRIGHRGACGYEPENTLRSFQKALALGADMVNAMYTSAELAKLLLFTIRG